MATIDYKQKIKDYMNSSEVDTLYKSMLNNLFPELAESDDERIRKGLLYIIEHHPTLPKEEAEEYIAWLKKQGEQKTIEYPLCKTVKDKIDYYIFNHFTTDTVVKTDVNSIVKAMEEGVMIGMSEQKPVDKKGMNLVEEEMTPFQKEVFCIIDTTIEEEQGLKQVCDKLFALASNEIKQKFSWSEEDESLYDYLLGELNASLKDYCGAALKDMEEAIDWFKDLKERVQSQPKQEWSEEDEKVLDGVITNYESGYLPSVEKETK